MSHALHTPRARALSRRTQVCTLCAVGAVLAAAVGLAHWLGREKPPTPAPVLPPGAFQATPEERANIVLAPVAPHSFADEVTTDGKVATDDDHTTQIFPPFTGRVTHVFVSAGEAVRQGEPLASFAANELIQLQSDLTAARGARRQAEAQLAQARATFDRQTALAKADAAAQRDVDQARTDLAAAEQAAANARAASVAAAARLSVLNLSEAPRHTGAAGDGRFLHEAVLVSPITGMVTQRQVGEGQFVNSIAGGASQPLLAVSDTRRLWLVANLRDSDAQAVRIGAPVQARIDALDGRIITGRINYVAPVVDPATRRVVVRAEIANPGGLLRPEMFAQIAIAAGPARTALAVPRAAVVYDGSKARVWVAKPNGVFSMRNVELGATRDGFVEVRSGLDAHDQVATAGALFLDEAGKGEE